MITNNNTWTSTIPASVPSGNYLIRFETIALHSLPAVRSLVWPTLNQLLKTPFYSKCTLSVLKSQSPVEEPLLQPLLSLSPSQEATVPTTPDVSTTYLF